MDLDLKCDKYIDKAFKDVHEQIDKRAGEIKDLKKEMRASALGFNQSVEMLEGQIDVLDKDAATFQIQMDSLLEKACHCIDRIVPVQKCEPDVVFSILILTFCHWKGPIIPVGFHRSWSTLLLL